MRDIRFKAKCLCDGEWVEGDPCHGLGGGLNILCFQEKEDGSLYFYGSHQINPSTVCQFTGIYDKDNKEIFENDLIQDTQTKMVFVVVWNPVFACYSFLDEKRNTYAAKNFADYPSKDFLIVGNRFDRKEEK